MNTRTPDQYSKDDKINQTLAMMRVFNIHRVRGGKIFTFPYPNQAPVNKKQAPKWIMDLVKRHFPEKYPKITSTSNNRTIPEMTDSTILPENAQTEYSSPRLK